MNKVVIGIIIFIIISLLIQNYRSIESFVLGGVETKSMKNYETAKGLKHKEIPKKKKLVDSVEDFYKRLPQIKKNYTYSPEISKQILKEYGSEVIIPLSYNKHIIYPRVMYQDMDKKYNIVKDILDQIKVKKPVKQTMFSKLWLSNPIIDSLGRKFVSEIFNKIKPREKFRFGKVVNPVIRARINWTGSRDESTIKYVLPIFLIDMVGVTDPECKAQPLEGKKSTHNYMALVTFEFLGKDDKIFKTIKDSITGVYFLGSLPEDQNAFDAANTYDHVFAHDTHYSWLGDYSFMRQIPKKKFKEILTKKERDKYLLQTWTNGKDYCVARKESTRKYEKEKGEIEGRVLALLANQERRRREARQNAIKKRQEKLKQQRLERQKKRQEFFKRRQVQRRLIAKRRRLARQRRQRRQRRKRT